MLISVIVPCFNEEKSIPIFYRELKKVISEIKDSEFEIIFIDDGSSDRTLEIIKGLRTRDSQVRYISFSRNFGKESAMYAGLRKSNGDLITIMDADLQDPPSL